MDKIRDQITKADIIVGDITGKNPNMFYELGLAHALGKTGHLFDPGITREYPRNIRQFEFIVYDLGRHDEFLANLDNAIQNVVGEKYKELYQPALDLLKEFNADKKPKYGSASRRNSKPECGLDKKDLLANFLLPKIIQNVTDINVMR